MQATARTASRRPAMKGNMTTIALAILAKGKTLLLGAAKLKYLYTILSAVVSVFAYAGRFGWEGAVGFVLLLFVHEMGHVLVLRAQGVPASLPLFIPFIGAVIGMKAYPKGVVDEAYSAIAGPVLGSVGALACLGAYFLTHNPLYAWLAYIGFFLNLFNLLPMSPLDGGRIIGAVWRGFWILGVVAAVALATFFEAPILMLFSIFGLNEINKRYISVHWAAYALLGVLAFASSVFCKDWIIGTIIALFAYFNAKQAYAQSSAASKLAPTPASLTIKGPKWCPLSTAYPGSARCARGKTVARWKNAPPVKGSTDSYFAVPKTQKLLIGSMYVGLASLLTGLIVWMHLAHIFKPLH